MSYQVLARRWRPRNFAEMVGQEHVVRALSNALDNDRLHHAYLFTGTRGVGKTTLARILSKSLNCEQGVSASPCGVCATCREIDEGRFVDLLEVDAASKTGVDDTRELLENVPYAPVRGRYKVYLIDEVHMFSGHSFNALLKTLEEPPPHVKFLLATTDPQKVPVTVLSRCLQFNLKRLPMEQIVAQFERILVAEQIGFDAEALGILARAADGSMRDGLSLLDQAIAFGGGRVGAEDARAMLGVVAADRLPEIVGAVARGDGPGAMASVADMAGHAPDFGALLRDLVLMLHRVALLQQVPDIERDSWEHGDRLDALAGAISPEELQLYYQIALVGQRDLELAPDARSGFEMVLLRMLAFRPDEAAVAIDRPKGQVATAPSSRPAVASGDAAAVDRPAGMVEKARSPHPPVSSGDAAKGTVTVTGTAAAREPTAPGGPGTPQAVDWHADWATLIGRLGLKGMAAQLAENSAVGRVDGDRLELAVDPACRGLLGSLAEQRLRAALAELAGRPIDLVLTCRELMVETPAQVAARDRLRRQADAEADIAADPLVRALQERCDAELVADSVRRLD
jgi:DNA polymerase III subunit gamma/tau